MELFGMLNLETLPNTARWQFIGRPFLGLAVLLAFCACEKSSKDYLADARDQLSGSSYEEAVTSADAGLAASPDAVSAWGLELVKLEALSRSGQGEAVLDQLDRLSDEHPDRITAADYSGTAQLLRTADRKADAITVLDMGINRFPDDAVINKMITDSIEKGMDPEELEQLRSLGYID
jgi:hypothetical protein